LYFFPVDNTLGREDEVLRSLLEKVEETTNDPEKSPWVKEERPIDWFKVMDKFDALKGSHMTLTMEDAMKIAEECSIVDEDEVEELLRFLNEMGAILWINEKGLRDVVILDPIEFLVKPASKLIVLNDDVKTRKELFDEIQLPQDIKKLDKREGIEEKDHYYRDAKEFNVRNRATGVVINAFTYFVSKPVAPKKPTGDYAQKIFEGCRDHGFPKEYVKNLERWFLMDPETP
jgi:Holliday junction resolvase